MTVQARRHSSAYKAPSPFARSYDTSIDVEKQPPPKRQSTRPYRSVSELEKGDDLLAAASYQPMTNAGSPSRRRSRMRAGFYRVPNRIMRWLCLSLFVALLLFVFTLFRFAFSTSTQKLPLDASKSVPKPPRWESFPFLKRYHGGIRTLVSRKENVPEYPGQGPEDLVLAVDKESETDSDAKNSLNERSEPPKMSSAPFYPYPDYNSAEYVKKYGEKRECFLDDSGTVRIPLVHHYPGVPRGFPDAIMGSNEIIGIRDDVCFDRFGRLGPYGLGYGVPKGGSGASLEGDREGAERVWEDIPPVDFRKVNWASAQNRCVAINNHRFKELPEPRINQFLSMSVGSPKPNGLNPLGSDTNAKAQAGTDHLPRTAVVIRTWHDFQYTPEDIMYLRSLISELSLLSGGEYVVHFLIHVKDENLQIWSDDETYDRVLSNSLPEEFHGMGTLWTERQMALMYPGLEETWARDLPVHGVYRSTFMCMQYFAHQHPEYDYFWNWEMDVRYTGHWYHLFDKVADWAKQQPRKGLWERNSRFYVPSVHGSWEEFKQMVRWHTQSGTNSPNNMWSPVKPGQDQHGGIQQPQGDKFIWGPERPDEQDVFEVEGEGIPPTTMEKDDYQWGVGEDADLIVFNPLYDPEGTTWLLREDVTGYHKKNGFPPRRAAIITASRLSRKLLNTMHRETSLQRHSMFSEMWPATTALHHGFKAVYVPHSVYVDRRWPPRYLELVFNAGRNGASGGARTSIFGEREHNFRGTTWFYSAGFSPNIWRRWLGYKVDNDGGEQEELAGEGRMCLPPMLLHPIKEVEMVIDSGPMAEA